MKCGVFILKSGAQQAIQKLNKTVTEKYRKWYRTGDRQIAGWVEVYGNTAFLSFKASGHFVPTDQPRNLLGKKSER